MQTPQGGTPAFDVVERHFGYIIAEDGDRFSRESLAEAALRFLGLVLILSAYAQWLLPGWMMPGWLFGGDVMVTKAGMSLLLGGSGAVLYWVASRGLALEVEVDVIRREIRVVHCNARGQRRQSSTIPMRDVASAFIRRRKDHAEAPKLYLRMRDRDVLLHIATGPEGRLSALHSRLSSDLRPAQERIDRRLAATVPFRSRRVA